MLFSISQSKYRTSKSYFLQVCFYYSVNFIWIATINTRAEIHQALLSQLYLLTDFQFEKFQSKTTIAVLTLVNLTPEVWELKTIIQIPAKYCDLTKKFELEFKQALIYYFV